MRYYSFHQKTFSQRNPTKEAVTMSRSSTGTQKEKNTREKQRKKLERFNLSCELFKNIKHFFPQLIPLLRGVRDPRKPGYISYDLFLILFIRILYAIFNESSMRAGTRDLNSSNAIDNIAKMLGYEHLQEIPHWSTINNCLEKLKPSDLESVVNKIAYNLIRSKAFNVSRIRNKYWQIIVDGTGLYSFSEKHCDHCLTKEHKEKNGVPAHTEYYHYTLEAKIVFLDDIVISIGTEFVENNEKTQLPAPKDGEKAKQDCELKAFYRLAEKIKTAFPRLPICLTMDSLYACEPVFRICRDFGWHFIIRFKDGSIKTLAEDFHGLKNMEPDQCFSRLSENIHQEYKFVCGLEYQDFKLNIAECVEAKPWKESTPFVFVTDLPITAKNCATLVYDGRRRWRIENEGFDIQKNHGYFLEHAFSEDYTGMKNHYLLTQIGHAISQIVERNLLVIKSITLTLAQLHRKLLEAFRTAIFTAEEIIYINEYCQIRLM
jgi:hypothetical protein